MDNNNFAKAWDVEYLCSRIKMIEDCVKNKHYSKAYSLFSTLQEKIQNAEYTLDEMTGKDEE